MRINSTNLLLIPFRVFFFKLSGVWCKNIWLWGEQRSQHLQQSEMVPIFSDLGGRSRDTLCQVYWLLLRLLPEQHWFRWQRTYLGSEDCACIIATAKLEVNRKWGSFFHSVVSTFHGRVSSSQNSPANQWRWRNSWLKLKGDFSPIQPSASSADIWKMSKRRRRVWRLKCFLCGLGRVKWTFPG